MQKLHRKLLLGGGLVSASSPEVEEVFVEPSGLEPYQFQPQGADSAMHNAGAAEEVEERMTLYGSVQ